MDDISENYDELKVNPIYPCRCVNVLDRLRKPAEVR